MSDKTLEDQLIHLGNVSPDVRPHIRPILAELKTSNRVPDALRKVHDLLQRTLESTENGLDRYTAMSVQEVGGGGYVYDDDRDETIRGYEDRMTRLEKAIAAIEGRKHY